VGPGRTWTTPSDLAEYAFCPRAHYYRKTREAPPTRSAEAGTAYHRRRLGSERWRAEHPGAAWIALLAGAALVAAALATLLR
jgi:hypothetical protein